MSITNCIKTLKANNEISPWLADDIDQALANRGRSSKKTALSQYIETALADMKAELEDIYDDVGVSAKDPLLGYVEEVAPVPVIRNAEPRRLETVSDIRHSPPRFISQLAVSIDQMPAKVSGTSASNVKMWLLSNKDKLRIKAEEINFSGVLDWLDGLGKQKVAREEVAAYLEQGGVKVNTVTLGEPDPYDVEQYLLDNNLVEDRAEMEAMGWEAARDLAMEEGMKATPKFGGYRLPGGEDYRELLLTLPVMNSELDAFARKRGFTVGFDGLSKSAQEDMRKAYAKEGSFQSSHWDQPNVLAHMRVDTVTGADGKRYLRVLELQSDFGQSYKKQRDAIQKAVDNDFNGIISAMKADGVLTVECD